MTPVPFCTESRSLRTCSGSVSGPCRNRLQGGTHGVGGRKGQIRSLRLSLHLQWCAQRPAARAWLPSSVAACSQLAQPAVLARRSPVMADHLLWTVAGHVIETLAGIHLQVGRDRQLGGCPGSEL